MSSRVRWFSPEVLNDFSKRGKYLCAQTGKFIEQLRHSPNITIVPQTSEQFATAVALYESRLDKEWSLTDCASFCIMQDYCLSEALAYDKHFEQAGYKAMMRDLS